MSVPEARRRQYRLIQEHKAPRRMRLADDISLLWESETTIDHQVAEMLWMEEDDDARAAIRSGYEDLRPRPGTLTATLMVEVKDPAAVKARLGYYAGLEHAIRLRTPTGDVPATIIGDHGTPEATTAVTYLRFDADARGAELVVDHPRLQGSWPLPDAVQAQPF